MPYCASSRYFGMPTRWRTAEGNTGYTAIARRTRIPRGQRPHARTQALCLGTGRSHVCLWLRELQAASGSRRTYGDEERTGEVGRFHRTSEIAEQSRGTGSGGDGGEGTGQGKLARVQRAPDSGPGWRAQRARAGTTSSKQG